MPKRRIEDDFEEWNPDGVYVWENGETLQYVVPQPKTDLVDSYERVNPSGQQLHAASNDLPTVYVEEPTVSTSEDPETCKNKILYFSIYKGPSIRMCCTFY